MIEFLQLKKSNCRNCYKCIRHCPVKSIQFSEKQVQILDNECILCGECFVICPQKAKVIVNDVDKVKKMLSDGEQVIASVAPSFAANYEDAGIGSMEEALKKLGFCKAEETAIGATMVKKEYERKLREDAQDIIISSCCHSVNLLAQKYYPNALKYLADVVTPMQAHCMDIKKRHPNAKTVFIGPCVSKKDEAQRYDGLVDCVLTFAELTEWLRLENISIDRKKDSTEESQTRLFPTTGGILKTMACDNPNYSYIAIDGAENCMSALKDIESGSISKCFIEMSICPGSCIGGPVMDQKDRSLVRDYRQISLYAGSKDFIIETPAENDMKMVRELIPINAVMPGNIEIDAILKKMGKVKPEHMLNCGSCGYNTCREKAIAVYQKKADLTMCLPFLKEKAESFSDNIVHNSPNGIIVLNEDLEVQQINRTACNIMNIRNESDVLNEPAVRILDPSAFVEAKQTGRRIHGRRSYLAEYKKYVEQTIFYDQEYRIIICIMRDITNDETDKVRKDKISRQTIETADQVVEKQMRVVQEIASLLGETAAETKIALTKLKESISDE